MIYIHFEDGKDVAQMESYKLNLQTRYVYTYKAITIVSPRRLKKHELAEKIRKKERLHLDLAKETRINVPKHF